MPEFINNNPHFSLLDSQFVFQLDYTPEFEPFADITFRSNSDYWLDTIHLSDRINHTLGIDHRMDRSFWGRTLLFLFSAYTNWASTFYSHEIAHVQIYRTFSIPTFLGFDFSDWRAAVPMLNKDSSEEVLFENGINHQWSVIGGLNQQQLNALHIYSHNIETQEFTFGEGLAYLLNLLSSTACILTEDALPQNVVGHGSGGYWVSLPDITRHLIFVNERHHVALTAERWLMYSAVFAFLNFHTWESIYASLNYLINGERQYEPLTFHSGNLSIAPPQFQVFPHPHGLYLLTTWPIGIHEGMWIFLNYGHGLVGDINGNRIGAEFRIRLPHSAGRPGIDLNLSTAITLRPENLEMTGYSFSASASFPISQYLFIRPYIGFSTNDPLENEILGNQTGEFYWDALTHNPMVNLEPHYYEGGASLVFTNM